MLIMQVLILQHDFIVRQAMFPSPSKKKKSLTRE